MTYGDIRDDWKFRDIENKAVSAERQANRANDEVALLREHVDRLEHSLREARSEVDGLRSRLDAYAERLDRLTEIAGEVV